MIIFDPSLILSLHVGLLGLVLADGAFAARNLTSAEQLSTLDSQPSYQLLLLLLNPIMDGIHVVRKSIKTFYGWAISPDQPLPDLTLLPWTESSVYSPDSHRSRARVVSGTARVMRSTRVFRTMSSKSHLQTKKY